MSARNFLYKNLKRQAKENFGVSDESYLSFVCDAWMNDEFNSAHRYNEMIGFIGDGIKTQRILDMASGCGSFVFYGLMNGYDVYGVDPEEWKHEFNERKAKEYDYPDSWMKRFYVGVGESLPFDDKSFDVISTYQTLEHVQSQEQCFEEFKRVLRPGGHLFVRCPDYTSFYEGHYRIPMLPLMNRNLFKIYLKLLKRPAKGLDTINYISRKEVIKLLGGAYQIHDLAVYKIRGKINHKIKVDSAVLANIYLTYSRIKTVFRSESSVNIVAIKN